MWMSKGSDQDYKPTLQAKKLSDQTADRPRRTTRKDVNYTESLIILESGEDTDSSSQGVVKGEAAITWAKGSRDRPTEIDGSDVGSDRTITYGSEPDGITLETSPQSAFWSPRTLQQKTTGLWHSVKEVQQQLVMATEYSKGGSASIEAMMQLLLQARLDDKERERKREEEREERAILREQERQEELRDRERREAKRIEEEYEREEKRQRREEKLWLAIKEAQPAVPQTVQLNSCKLPKMKEGEDITSFMEMFEAALYDFKIPQTQWKARVHTALDTPTKLRVRDVITDHGSTYEDLKTALLGCSSLSFSHASDTIMTGDRGSIFSLPPRQAFQRWQNLLERLTREATDIKSACSYMAAALLRFNCSLDLRTYLDTKGDFDKDIFCRNIEEWLATRPAGVTWAKQKQTKVATSPGFQKKGVCFHCGKGGHFAFECRSRLAGDKPALPRQEAPSHTQQPQTKETPKATRPGERDMSQVTCFRCRQQGHISPNCPRKTSSKVKRVKLREDLIEKLRSSEVFGAVGPYRMPITCDTGAEITVVPEEAVDQDQFTGETCELRSFNDGKSLGKRCVVDITVGGHRLTREAVTQPGHSLGWSVCLSLNLANSGDRTILMDQITRRANMLDKDLLYFPPEVREGYLVSGIPVEEAHVVKAVKWRPPEPIQVSVPAAVAETQQSDHKNVANTEKVTLLAPIQGQQVRSHVHTVEGQQMEEEYDDEVAETKVEGNSELILEKDEAVGDSLGGRADIEGQVELPVQSIREGMPMEGMVTDTSTDPSLTTILKLASLDKDGYHMSNGLIFRTRLDTFGTPREQLCVPQKYRQQCLKAAHSSFGHQGRNRMVALLRPHFYWPCMARDCVAYIRSCEKCQVMDRSLPRPPVMTEREVVTRPFSDVAIDIVGPFPMAKGGFKFMMTCVDTASRWPEAFPIRSTTSRTIIGYLTQIFTRWGFPVKLTSDNGPQFTSSTFTKWLRDKGITHARATPYHPQANGIVERLHRTLNSVIAKTIACKGDWAAVLPMALFFLRCTPTTSTGISPFLITHGWEPTNPIQLLYKSWVDVELRGVDLSEWVLDNADRVEAAREQATLRLIENSRYRAEMYNRKAKDRSFSVGDKVWVRRPGLDHKLRESWVGPGVVLKVNSPTSFRVQTPERTIPTVAIQQLKLATSETVKRITTVVEDEGLMTSLASTNVVSETLTDVQQKQLQEVLDSHSSILTKEPGLTGLVTFDIDTGEADPIHQRPYSTPVALKAKVDEELSWLLEKGYIVPSSSPWASPMVTVRKADGSARLCVDFRKINSLTRPMPFFMPRVEEVIEGIGKARFISKLDLSKGFYQVPLTDSAMQKTAFTCHKGTFHFTRMPFGVKNAPACFQTLMQRALADVTEFSTAYMDDVVIFSPTWEDHVVHVHRVLESIEKAGLTVNPKKCCWGGRAVEFLGHFVGRGSMSVPAHRCTALANYTKPKTKKGLRAFLGSVGFYRRYLAQLANWTSILTPKTSRQASPIVEWTVRTRLLSKIYVCFSVTH